MVTVIEGSGIVASGGLVGSVNPGCIIMHGSCYVGRVLLKCMFNMCPYIHWSASYLIM